jgi:hypothetical protein
MELRRALQLLDAVQAVPTPDETESSVELCPESLATISSYALSPEAEQGLYGVVDIGAWTTDVSFFRLTDIDRDQTGVSKVAFYAARSHRVAANAIDERCMPLVLEPDEARVPPSEELLATIRDQRERGTFEKETLRLGEKSFTPRASALEFSRDLVAEGIQRRFISTFKDAYDKEKIESRWNNVRLLYSGGGASEPRLLEAMTSHNKVVRAGAVERPSNLRGADAID